MSSGRATFPRTGSLLALGGIILLALNLRTAVASLSPVLDAVSEDVPMSSVGIGLLGTLAPICFAVFGLLAPGIARRIGLQSALILALAAMTAGHLLRGLGPGYLSLAVGSALAFAGIGVGNVLLPPAVKRWFPHRLGALTAMGAALLAVSTAIPAAVAAPVADAAGWRTSLSVWAAVTLVAVLPWIGLWVRDRRPTDGDAGIVEPELPGGIWKSPIAWACAVVFAASSFNAYAMFAWLPEILHDVAGADRYTAGALLSLFAIAGFPASIVVPLLAVRMRSVTPLLYAGAAFFLIGYGGLLLAPTTLTWLWVLAAGLGPLLFPVALILINLRSRTQDGSAALSGFTQGVGYLVAAAGPLLLGLLHDLTGGWTASLILCALMGVSAVGAAAALVTPRMIEDDLARINGNPVEEVP
ncbi:MAG TPA: MFS transporter [Naasia sp.]